VVGIVASRLKEGFDRPAIVIGKDGKGSCRSIDGFNMGAAVILARQQGLLLKGGGHPAAAGFTLDPAKLDEFRDIMNAAMEGVERPPLMADLTFKCSDINLELVNNCARLAPFGAGNPEPIVKITDAVISDARILSERHVRIALKSGRSMINAILFGGVGSIVGDAMLEWKGKEVEIYGTLNLNDYNGKLTVQIFPQDIRLKRTLGAPEMVP